jgi:hypothetical protein
MGGAICTDAKSNVVVGREVFSPSLCVNWFSSKYMPLLTKNPKEMDNRKK